MISIAKNIYHEVNNEWTVWTNVTSVAELNVHSGPKNQMVVDQKMCKDDTVGAKQ
jgi:hypothetical protein